MKFDIELKPCPFCNGKADISANDFNDYNGTYKCEAYCLDCFATIKRQYTVPPGTRYPLRAATEYIAKIWNKRKSATPKGVADRANLLKEDRL